MAISNIQRLTRGGQKYAAKKKAKNTEEVSFDPESRTDFLTGFHKRKLARQAEGRRKIEELNRQQRLEERRKIREERRTKVEKGLSRLQQAEEIIDRKVSEKEKKEGEADGNESDSSSLEDGEEEEFEGFEDHSGILKRRDAKYGDSNVSFEEINLDPYVDISRSEEVLDESTRKANEYAAYVASLKTAKAEATKKAQKTKNKKFRYLPKMERKLMNRRNKAR